MPSTAAAGEVSLFFASLACVLAPPSVTNAIHCFSSSADNNVVGNPVAAYAGPRPWKGKGGTPIYPRMRCHF